MSLPPRLLRLAFPLACASFVSAAPLAFDLGPGGVPRDALYSRERGHGFEPGTSATSSHFTVRLPHEGNWRVTVIAGSDFAATDMAIKAELRRLMVERITAPRGGSTRVSFVVNTRTPVIPAIGDIKAGEVRLKAPRESVQEAWAWDDALTLEFVGAAPAVRRIEIEPAEVPALFLIGDSTVCDQSKEPYNSWGQMLTRFFQPTVAIANHGESGETYRDSIGRRRLDKILSAMRPGDWLLMQFGHNDQKQIATGNGGPFTTYKAEIKRHVDGVRARGGVPVIVSPMERRGFDEAGRVLGSLADYAEASKQAAQELGVAFIDLNAMSKELYAALGREKSALAFAAPGGRVDNTHHNNFGSYQLAQCIAQAIRAQNLPIAEFLSPEFKGFDPARPDDPAKFAVPASADFTNQRPLGDEANRQ